MWIFASNFTVTVHEGKTFKCHFCSSKFTAKCNLKPHVASIHEGKQFKCDFCSSSFKQKGNLNKHIESFQAYFFEKIGKILKITAQTYHPSNENA